MLNAIQQDSGGSASGSSLPYKSTQLPKKLGSLLKSLEKAAQSVLSTDASATSLGSQSNQEKSALTADLIHIDLHGSLGGERLKDEHLKILIESIEKQPFLMAQIKSLDLSHNYITELGAKLLSEGPLKRWPTLMALNISYNPIACPGVKHIQQALSRDHLGNASLMSLSMKHTSMSGEGAEIIAALLSDNDRLTNLDISHNPLGNKVSYIAQALLSNTTLKALDLSHTMIQENGAAAFAAVLSQASNSTASLRDYLEVFFNSFLGRFTSNESLVELILAGNPISEQGWNLLLKAQKTHPKLKFTHEPPPEPKLKFTHEPPPEPKLKFTHEPSAEELLSYGASTSNFYADPPSCGISMAASTPSAPTLLVQYRKHLVATTVVCAGLVISSLTSKLPTHR